MDKIIILDIETTGLYPYSCDITEIAAIKVDTKTLEIEEEFVSLVKTQKNAESSLNDITNKMINKKGRKLRIVLKDLINFCGTHNIYAHFASFDKKFIRKALNDCGISFNESKWIDTIKIFRKKLPGHSTYKLEYLIKVYGLADKESHRALQDAKHTLEIMRIAEGFQYTPKLTPSYLINTIFNRIVEISFEKSTKYNFDNNDKTWITLSNIINKNWQLPFSKKYKNIIKKYNKTKIIRGRKKLVQYNPHTITGTVMDQMVEYFYNPKDYLRRIKADNKIMPFILKKINNVNLGIYEFLAIGFSIHYYRGGKDEDFELAKKSLKKKVDPFFVQYVEPYIPLAQEQAKYLNGKTIFNPIFGSNDSGIRADGDYIIDGKLCEMKTSKKPSFLIEYQIQLISYILLNKNFSKRFSIQEDKVLFWNPVFNIFEEFEIVINEEIEQEFISMLRALNFFKKDPMLVNYEKNTSKIMTLMYQRQYEGVKEYITQEEIEELLNIYKKLLDINEDK